MRDTHVTANSANFAEIGPKQAEIGIEEGVRGGWCFMCSLHVGIFIRPRDSRPLKEVH